MKHEKVISKCNHYKLSYASGDVRNEVGEKSKDQTMKSFEYCAQCSELYANVGRLHLLY